MAEPFLGAPATTMTATSGEVGRAASELTRAASQLQATSASMQSAISQMARGPMGAVAGMGAMAAGYSAFMGTGVGQGLRGMGAGMAGAFIGPTGMMPMGPGGSVPQSAAPFGRAFGASAGFIDPMESRRFGAMHTMAASQQRAAQLSGDRMMAIMGGVGGAASIASDLGVGALATWGAGKAGIGGFAGLGLGMAAGLPVGAAVGFAADQTMKQATQMRALGQQVNQNAFRFMDPRALSGGRMTSQQQLDVGRRLGRLGNEDLAFSQGEMSEILSGMQQNDLLRGVRSTDDLVQAVRQGKETIKTIMRNMGQSIREAGQTMAEMQGMGFDMRTPQGRAAIFGAGSVMGMGRGEAFAGAAAVGRQFAGQGLGQQMFGVGMMSQQLGQGAIMGGMSQRLISQAGGREGVNQLFSKAIGNFVQTAEGKSVLAAGMQGGEFNFDRITNRSTMELLGQAGGAASQENILALAADPQAATREMLRTPERRAQTAMMLVSRAVEKAQQTLGPDASPADITRAARIHMSQAYGLTLQEAETMMESAMMAPESLKAAQRQGATTVGNEITTRVLEQRSLIARARREVDRLFEGPGGAVAGASAGMERASNRFQTMVREGVLGTRMRSMRAEDAVQLEAVDVEKSTQQAARSRQEIAEGERVRDYAAKVVERNYAKDRTKAERLATEIRDSEPDRARDAANDLLADLSEDLMGTIHVPQYIMREEVAKKMGLSMKDMMGTGGTAGRVDEKSQQFGSRLTEILQSGSAFHRPEVVGPAAGIGFIMDMFQNESGLEKEQVLNLGREKSFREYVKAKASSDAKSPKGQERIKRAKAAMRKELTKKGGMMGREAFGRLLDTLDDVTGQEGGAQELLKVVQGFEETSAQETRQIANLGLEAGMLEAIGEGLPGLGGLATALGKGDENLFRTELGSLDAETLRAQLGGDEAGSDFAASQQGRLLLQAVESITSNTSADELRRMFPGEQNKQTINKMLEDGLAASEVGELRRAKLRGTGISGVVTTGADVGSETANAIALQQQSINNLDNTLKHVNRVLIRLEPLIMRAAGPDKPIGGGG